MIQRVAVEPPLTLSRYADHLDLAPAVEELRASAGPLVAELAGRRVWMVNSTAQGGGVAEMLPRQIALLHDLGVEAEWWVLQADDPAFFELTKQLHNLIHGAGEAQLGPAQRRLFESVNTDNAQALEQELRPGDLLVVHDPQPMPLAGLLRERAALKTIWRCHIGLDSQNTATRAAWEFLRPYADAYDAAVFTAAEYVPAYLSSRASIVRPSLDPLSPKNRPLAPDELVSILWAAGLMPSAHPMGARRFTDPVRRLCADGQFHPASAQSDLGLLFRPVVAQISRWDRLKGFGPLLEGFIELKHRVAAGNGVPLSGRSTVRASRLVLAGPDPSAIQDDPEALEVLAQMTEAWRGLPPALQEDVALLALPMTSAEENALAVNALQSASTVVVQNSLEEGFGLTATEALWKGKAVLASGACGLRQQIRDGVDGRLNPRPEDPGSLADLLGELLADAEQRAALGRGARRRVYEEFLIFGQLRRWLELLGSQLRSAAA